MGRLFPGYNLCFNRIEDVKKPHVFAHGAEARGYMGDVQAVCTISYNVLQEKIVMSTFKAVIHFCM
jgi:hypothetical protein